MGEWKIVGGQKSGKMENILVCLVGGVEKQEGEKLFCLVGEKNGRMKNVIYIN